MKTRRWVAFVAALGVLAILLGRHQGATLVHALGLESDFSGLRLELAAKDAITDATLAALQHRLSAAKLGGQVRRGAPGRVVVDVAGGLPGGASGTVHDLVDLHRLELYAITDASPGLRRLLDRARAGADPEVRVVEDGWENPRAGFVTSDVVEGPPERIVAWIAGLGDDARGVRLERVADRGLARARAVDAEPVVAAAQIDHALATYDPVIGRKEATVFFTRAGAARLGEWTTKHVGQKLGIVVDGTVVSAPVVAGPILGGRATLDLEAGRAADDARLDTDALVLALGDGRLEQELTLERESQRRASAVGTAAPIVIEVLLAALAGLVVWLAGAALARAPFEWIGAGAPGAARAAPWGRALVTLSASVAVWFLRYVPLPGLDGHTLRSVGALDTTSLSVFALGLGPALTAFLFVEVVALLVPPLARRRHAGARARRPLFVAAMALTLVLALVQAYFVAAWMSGIDGLLGDPPGQSFALVVVSLVAGALLFVGAARLLSRFGLASGWATLLVALWLRESATRLLASFGEEAAPAETWAILAGVVLLVALATFVLTGARARLAQDGPRLRLPTSGAVPLGWAAFLLAVVQLGARFGLPVPARLVAWLDGDAAARVGVVLALAALVTFLAAALFSWPALRPGRLSELRAQSTSPRDLARLWLVATLASLPWILAVALAATLVRARAGHVVDLVGAAALGAFVLDLASEWRARRRLGPLVAVAECHDVQGVDALVARLAAEGVPAFARTAHQRSLFYFFAPYLPVVIAVPKAEVARARPLVPS